MERVITLNERLQDQLKSNASANELLLTVQMMQSELMHILSSETSHSTNKPAIAVHIQAHDVVVEKNEITSIAEPEESPAEIQPEKIVHLLEVDEQSIEEELEQIKKSAEAKITTSIKNKPIIQFDPIEDTPTLLHQRPESFQQSSTSIEDKKSASLNDQLRHEANELSDSISSQPIKDLKKAIGVNDRFVFINELFQGDEVMYERSLKTINAFTIYPEAEFWIRRELKLKLGWDEKSESVKYFNHLVKRRFDFT